jgi:hypothetical protein
LSFIPSHDKLTVLIEKTTLHNPSEILMTTKGLGTLGRITLGFFLPVGLAVAAFVAAIKLLHPRPLIAEVLTAALTLLVLGYSLFMARQEARRWDEVQRAGAGFANSNGWVWGGFATLFLLGVPPVIDRVVDALMSVRPAGSMDVHLAMRLGLTFGATLVMVMQALAIAIASVIWGLRMRGPREQ